MHCWDCKHHKWAELSKEWQCWKDGCIHEGEERDNLQPACKEFEPEQT